MHPADLEALVSRELRQLPALRAPETLLPRVLAAVQEWTVRPWYTRAWFSWPLEWQIASITALFLTFAGGVLLLPGVESAAAGVLSAPAAGALQTGGEVVQRVEVATRAARVLWRTFLEPFVAYAFVLVALMGLACAAFGAALNHVVLERAVQR